MDMRSIGIWTSPYKQGSIVNDTIFLVFMKRKWSITSKWCVYAFFKGKNLIYFLIVLIAVRFALHTKLKQCLMRSCCGRKSQDSDPEEPLCNSYGLIAYTPGNELTRIGMSPLFSELRVQNFLRDLSEDSVASFSMSRDMWMVSVLGPGNRGHW